MFIENAAFEDCLGFDHCKLILMYNTVYYQYLTAVCAHSLLVRILSFSSLSGIWLELKRKLSCIFYLKLKKFEFFTEINAFLLSKYYEKDEFQKF